MYKRQDLRLAHYKLKMILSDKKILEAIEQKNIIIEPYDKSCLGTNSYDVHLGKTLAVYTERMLDAKKHNAKMCIRDRTAVRV